MTDSRVSAPLRFEILGEVRVLRAGAVVDLGPAKQRAVLAVLLVQAGRPVPTHQIVDAVWGDEPPENGANVVQKYVAGLRRVLDPDRAPRTQGELIALTGNGYLLRVADGTFDADEFTAAVTRAGAERLAGRLSEAADILRTALALWRGDGLAGLTGPVFDTTRTRLGEARATAWEKWAEIELALGRQTALIPDLVRLVGEFPLREGLRAQLMIALHQDGRQAEALAVFRDARAYLVEEFGVEPGERMREAHRKILQGEAFSAEPVDSDPLDRPGPVPPGSPAPVQAYPTPPPAPAQWPVSDATSVTPVSMYGFGATRPRKRRGNRYPALAAIIAAVIPFATFGMGAWIYFAWVGVRQRDRRQFVVGAGYLAGFVLAMIFILEVDPNPLDEPNSGATNFGVLLLLLNSLGATGHGAILALWPWNSADHRNLREQARWIVRTDPAQARQLGIGRPEMLRWFDDGGLVDINHAPPEELARLRGISPLIAHRIAIDRAHRGPYAEVDDLVGRGILTAHGLKTLRGRLVAVP